MQLIVASRNPVKIDASLEGFQSMFPEERFEVEGISAESGVSDQPMTDEETLTGARNRATHAKTLFPDADFWIGIEGGLEEIEEEHIAFAWVCILSHADEGRARSASFTLPPKVSSLIREGMELGDADDQVFGSSNSKQKNGAVGLLTGNVMVRKALYAPAVVLALIPFRNSDLFNANC